MPRTILRLAVWGIAGFIAGIGTVSALLVTIEVLHRILEQLGG